MNLLSLIATLKRVWTYFHVLIAGVISNPTDKKYNAFPMVTQHPNGANIGIYKKAYSHAPIGPLMFIRSNEAGVWAEEQITVDGVPIESVAHSFFVVEAGPHAGRQLICYQDDETYISVKMAYRDALTGSFISAGSYELTDGTQLSLSPVKMLIMPEGDIFLGYYTENATDHSTGCKFLKSNDTGVSWQEGGMICINYETPATTSDYTLWRCHEFGWTIIDTDGTNAGTRMVAIIRIVVADGGASDFFRFYKSEDGGETWYFPTEIDGGTYARGLWLNPAPSPNPLDILNYNGSILVAEGMRSETYGFKLIYWKYDDPEVLWINNQFEKPNPIAYTGQLNAQTLGNGIDCGYPVMFPAKISKDAEDTQVWSSYYDVSPYPRDEDIAERRVDCLIARLL